MCNQLFTAFYNVLVCLYSMCQSFSIRTAKDWNSLSQSVVAADSSLFSTVQESAGQEWSSVGAQLFVGVMLQYGALPTNYPDPDPDV